MNIARIQALIERVPWYLFGALVIFCVVNIYLNVENSRIVIFNVIGSACLAYVAFNNWERQNGNGDQSM